MVSLISHMHPMLIKTDGCVTDLIELLCLRTSAVVNDVNSKSNGTLVFQLNRESDNRGIIGY